MLRGNGGFKGVKTSGFGIVQHDINHLDPGSLFQLESEGYGFGVSDLGLEVWGLRV